MCDYVYDCPGLQQQCCLVSMTEIRSSFGVCVMHFTEAILTRARFAPNSCVLWRDCQFLLATFRSIFINFPTVMRLSWILSPIQSTMSPFVIRVAVFSDFHPLCTYIVQFAQLVPYRNITLVTSIYRTFQLFYHVACVWSNSLSVKSQLH